MFPLLYLSFIFLYFILMVFYFGLSSQIKNGIFDRDYCSIDELIACSSIGSEIAQMLAYISSYELVFMH